MVKFAGMAMEISFLGTGTSVGVPMIGCHCAVCGSGDRRNRRRRACLYVRAGETALVIDTPPDFRQQMLDAKVERLDAVVFTHAHADHIFGFDDIRRFNTLGGGVLPAYAGAETLAELRRVFCYVSDRPDPSGLYRPLIDFRVAEGPFEVGAVRLTPLEAWHGAHMTGYLLESGGVRVGYVPDCCGLPEATLAALEGVDVMVLDMLRERPHPAHLCLADSLELLGRIGAGAAYLTHMCHDVDHAEMSARLPQGVFLSYDGLTVGLARGAAGVERKESERW